jgi:hypothetical protein
VCRPQSKRLSLTGERTRSRRASYPRLPAERWASLPRALLSKSFLEAAFRSGEGVGWGEQS